MRVVMQTSLKSFLLVCTLLASGMGAVSAHADDCVGDMITPPEGLVAASDEALLASALGAAGKGALCKGQVFVAEKPVTVYRVWDAAKSYTLYGRWWSFDAPKGPRDAYQLANGICPEWSPLNIMSSCTLKVGSKIVLGPGQSAQCSSALLPASSVNQVYVPNDSRNDVLMVENCSPGATWP